MGSKIFITATDTDAGKTWITASLIQTLLKQGKQAMALKPVACGLNANGDNDDISTLLAAQYINAMHPINFDHINRYCFKHAAAPSQAAAAQQQNIDPNTLLQWCKRQADQTETCLIEGVGGLMTPLTATWLVSDWIKAMPEYKIWLVVNCKLGSINQTLLTLDKLNNMGRNPDKIFFNATTLAQNNWIESTRQAVQPFLQSQTTVQSLHFGAYPSL